MRDLPLSGVGRGLAFQLVDALGCLPVAEAGDELRLLDRAARRALARAGVRFGAESVYIEPLLGADSARFRALLWAVRHGRPVPKLPGTRALGKAIAVDPALPHSFYTALGRRVVDGLALRPDRLERLAAAARSRNAPFAADAELAGLAGVAHAGDLRRRAVGARLSRGRRDGAELFVPRPRRAPAQPNAGAAAPTSWGGDGHPFAKLKELRLA